MMRRNLGIGLLVGLAYGGSAHLQGARSLEQTQFELNHVAWVAEPLKRGTHVAWSFGG